MNTKHIHNLLYIFCLLIVFISCKTNSNKIITSQNYNITKVAPDSILYYSIDSFRQILNSKMNTIVGYLDSSLDKGKPESKLGNYAANACLWQYSNSRSYDTNCFVMLNNGSLRATLPMGEVLTRHLYELMPFENKLVALLLKGKTVIQLFNYIANKGGNPVANLNLSISKNGKWNDAKINGKFFDSTQNYYFVTSDYLANGGDNCSFLSNAINRIDLDIKVRDALIFYLNKKSSKTFPLKIQLENRIRVYE